MSADFTVVDIETTGSLPWTGDLVAVGLGDRVYRPEEGREAAQAVLAGDGVIVAQTNYDLRWLCLDGATLGPDLQYHDTKVMAWMDDSAQELALDALAKKYLRKVPKKPIRIRRGRVMFDLGLWRGRPDLPNLIPIEDVPWPTMRAYCLSDVTTEAALYEALRDRLQAKGLWGKFLEKEAPLSKLLIEMETTGLPFDRERAEALLADTTATIEDLREKLARKTGAVDFNPASPPQVAAYLYTELWSQRVKFAIPRLNGLTPEEKREKVEAIAPPGVEVESVGRDWAYGIQWLDGLGLKPPKPARLKPGEAPKKHPTASSKKLDVLYGDHPWIAAYVEFRKAAKLEGYLRGWIEMEHRGLLHGRFDQSGTISGRLAGREPNLQQVSKESDVRTLFRGDLVVGDYCVAPNMRVLTQDLRWIPAGDLSTGDALIGFDEEGEAGGRCLRPSEVTSVARKNLPSVEVVTDQGTWIVSEGHGFLTRELQRSMKWKRADQLNAGDSIAWVGEPWETDTSRDAGYLAGFLDGEGWVSRDAVGYAQKDGTVLDTVQRLLRKRGVDPGRKYGSNSSAIQYRIRGGVYADLRVLGTLRPLRLLEKANRRWEGLRVRNGVASPAAIVQEVRHLGNREVVAFSTTTRTFIMEGSFSHNSQLEARIAAGLSGDPFMLDIFHDERDLYGVLAANAWGGPEDKENPHRDLAKVVWLASQYGARGDTLAQTMAEGGVRGYSGARADELLAEIMAGVPRLFEWREEVIEQARIDGYVTTIGGRLRALADINSAAWQLRFSAERQAVSMLVQGSAADVVNAALLAAREAVAPSTARICLQVHDEIIWKRGKRFNGSTLARLKDVCENGTGFDLGVPLVFEVATAESWADKA